MSYSYTDKPSPDGQASSIRFPFVHVTRFRGLKDLRLEECGQINLLVGGNNSGKTSVLEAIHLLAAPVDLAQWETTIHLRSTWPLSDTRFRAGGIDRLDALFWMFPQQGHRAGTIEIAGDGQVGHFVARVARVVGDPPSRPIVQRDLIVEANFRSPRTKGMLSEGELDAEAIPGLEIEVITETEASPPHLFEAPVTSFRMVMWETGRSFRQRNPSFGPAVQVAFITPISHRSDGYLATLVSSVIRDKTKHRTIELLKRLDPRVTDLVILTPGDGSDSGEVRYGSRRAALHVEYEGTGLVPVHAMGDGMRRAVHFASVVASLSDGGVLLVDEIEVGMHTTVLEQVFAWLRDACTEASIQLFATTHSLEAVDAMLAGASDEDLVLYRIQDSEARRFSGRTLRLARHQFGQEVR